MRFFDGGLPDEPADRAAPARIVLERRMEEGEEAFAMLRRIGYDDRRLGELLVPADPVSFRSDLTSVPRLLTWLVPRSGRHLPAALLHDGLVETDPALPPTYVAAAGHAVTRVQADRVFRDAMGDLGVPLVRRWLVWSAVTVATMVDGRGTGWGAVRRVRYRAVALLTLLVTVTLGVLATLDLLDVGAGWVAVPWIGEAAWWLRLAQGLAGAVLAPAALSLLWGRFVVAGVIANVALALLLHVTVALAVAYAAYLALETALSGTSRSASRPRRSGSRTPGS